MCTVSWVVRDATDRAFYDLFFNRDESRRRGRAFPPSRVDLADDVPAVMPTDTDAGGTWVVANGHGLTVALLNLYQAGATSKPPSAPRSRGLLVRDLGDAPNFEAVADRLAAIDPSLYRPFTLLVVDPAAESPRIACWDGATLGALEPAEPPLVSSGHDLPAALAHRRALWRSTVDAAGGLPTADDCLAFHRSHQPSRGPLSPCMHRHDARTVSLVHVRVTPERVAMRYADGPPCRSPLGEAVGVDRIEQVMPDVSDADAA